MTSFSRAVSAPVIYAVLAAGALIILAPFAIGLMTSFTTVDQFNTGEPLSFRHRQRCRTTPGWPTPASAARWW